uniref:MOLYBDENUM COFACTOR CARRIER PROTEIN COFACTOR, METAL TRANSPORT.6A n=1 Tax=Siphoviridae sp. ctZHD14 TaxID=2827891 RepID=A0A8S5SX20_9CAUD|nr:MAG TPA: MOLYBDENUM COFACTOR CARRIER PROTEIN COFACTOR, METAL TRANSPORT.6A [Siphoviridae sp. ctZHD14]
MPKTQKKIVLICGSKDVDYLPNVLNKEEIGCVINSGEDTVDWLSEQWAKRNKIEYLAFAPNYKTWLDEAEEERDRQMVNFCDEVVFFWKSSNDRLIKLGKYARKHKKKITMNYIE